MTFEEISLRFKELSEACRSGAKLEEAWRKFHDAVQASRDDPPYHMVTLLSTLKRTQGDGAAEDVMILEHGCGGGFSSIYLLALGYRGIHGVDLGGDSPVLNTLLSEVFGIDEPRFHVYDGKVLPFADESMDYVFSQQVLEHVNPSHIEDYYAEEGRILKSGGVAYHEVPHRLTPFDTHSKTWFIHYFPKRVRKSLYRVCRVDPDYIEKILHLRTPFYHRRQILHHIGPYEDITLDRLVRSIDFTYYDGSLLPLRKLAHRLAVAPALGGVARRILRELVMLETIASKRSTARRS